MIYIDIFPYDDDCTEWGWGITIFTEKRCNSLSPTTIHDSKDDARNAALKWTKEMDISAEFRESEDSRYFDWPLKFRNVQTFYCTCGGVGIQVAHYPADSVSPKTTHISYVAVNPHNIGLWDRIKKGFRYIFTGKPVVNHTVELEEEGVKALIDFLQQSFIFEEKE
jgi:hypothetical protein